jgi:hypothetical protein
MRVTTRTEAAARQMLQDMVDQGVMTQKDATRLFKYAYSQVVVTLGNWRRRNAKPEAIEEAIGRRIKAARVRVVHAPNQNAKNLAHRDLIVALMFQAVWNGMQEDVAAYSGR